jgi:hypothetical protein
MPEGLKYVVGITGQAVTIEWDPSLPNGPHEVSKVVRTASSGARALNVPFIAPEETERLKVPNACTACHMDKNAKWATEQLRVWEGVSPWRVGD